MITSSKFWSAVLKIKSERDLAVTTKKLLNNTIPLECSTS
jgi:hypothetical protein